MLSASGFLLSLASNDQHWFAVMLLLCSQFFYTPVLFDFDSLIVAIVVVGIAHKIPAFELNCAKNSRTAIQKRQ